MSNGEGVEKCRKSVWWYLSGQQQQQQKYIFSTSFGKQFNDISEKKHSLFICLVPIWACGTLILKTNFVAHQSVKKRPKFWKFSCFWILSLTI